MSHVIVRNSPFAAGLRVAQNGARELLLRDRARAAKLLAGVSPHGPKAFLESFRRHRETDTSASPVRGSTLVSGSVDVSDAGMSAIESVNRGLRLNVYLSLKV